MNESFKAFIKTRLGPDMSEILRRMEIAGRKTTAVQLILSIVDRFEKAKRAFNGHNPEQGDIKLRVDGVPEMPHLNMENNIIKVTR